MYAKLLFFTFISLLLAINGQNDESIPNYPIARYLAGRTSTETFENQFSRGRCPRRFYQLGEECVYFATDGRSYSSRQAERVCSQRISKLLDEPAANNPEQPNMQPTRGVRQLTLNTPEKTDILRAISREYNEENYAIGLSDDYNTLTRCQDGQDDRWPQFCTNDQYNKSACYEVSSNPNGVCVRQVDCRKRDLRVACEFTLPGSSEITTSKFRTCLPVRGRSRRLPNWAWILIFIGAALLLLGLIGGLIAFLQKKKRSAVPKNRSLPEPRRTPPEPRRTPTEPRRTPQVPKREDPATRPMLIKNRPIEDPDSGYLQAEPRDNTANA